MQQILKNFNYKPNILLPIFAFFLPLLPQVSQGAIALYLIFWVINKQYLHLHKVQKNWFALSAILYFLLFLISGLYSQNLATWGSDLEAKLPLLVVPILLFSQAQYSKKVVNIVLWALTFGCFVFTIYIHYVQLSDAEPLRSLVHHNSYMNVIYFSMYLSVVLFFLLKNIITSPSSPKRWLYIIAAIFAHYALFAFASRMAILATIVVELGVVFLWKIIIERKFITGVALLLLTLAANAGSLYASDNALKRFQTLSSGEQTVRLKIWEASWTSIKKSPIIGYGSGDTKDILRPVYDEIDYSKGAKKNQNSHNQYLETWLSIGIIGLLIFMTGGVSAWFQSWKREHYIFCIFLALVFLNLLTESMFERQQGTYFVAFFGSLLLWNEELNETSD